MGYIWNAEVKNQTGGRRNRLKRAGCVIGTIVWFILLILPCFAIILLTRDEIVIQVGDLPGQSVRLWLVSGVKERGLGISIPSVQRSDDEQKACLTTNVQFLLWAGQNMPTQYCECFSHQGQSWKQINQPAQNCEP